MLDSLSASTLLDSLSTEGDLLFLSASQDQNIHLWQLSTADSTLSLRYEYKGHARSVEAIAVSPDATKVNSSTCYNVNSG